MTKETDPTGKSPHSPGAKLDAGKRRDGLVLLAFSRALAEVSKVGTYGATKYTENGWTEVPNGISRYTDAMLRHMLAEGSGEHSDKDTGLLHAAHAAWNALARLDLMIRESEKAPARPQEAPPSADHYVCVGRGGVWIKNAGQAPAGVDPETLVDAICCNSKSWAARKVKDIPWKIWGQPTDISHWRLTVTETAPDFYKAATDYLGNSA